MAATKYLKPTSTLLVGVAIGYFVVPRLRAKVGG
jgi:hypothetical protein